MFYTVQYYLIMYNTVCVFNAAQMLLEELNENDQHTQQWRQGMREFQQFLCSLLDTLASVVLVCAPVPPVAAKGG